MIKDRRVVVIARTVSNIHENILALFAGIIMVGAERPRIEKNKEKKNT